MWTVIEFGVEQQKGWKNSQLKKLIFFEVIICNAMEAIQHNKFLAPTEAQVASSLNVCP